MITTVRLDNTARSCLVTQGDSGRSFFTTPKAFALALLGSGAVQDAADTSSSFEWSDFLATHGIAVGRRLQDVATLAVLPSKARQVRLGSTDYTLTFPALLMCILTSGGRFQRAGLWVPDPARISTLSVVSTTAMLASFPYGNVYRDHGGICWGSVSSADVHTLADLESLFFGSGFNSDLVDEGMFPSRNITRGGTTLPVPTTFTKSPAQAVGYLLRE
jgi:hypothetical protein